MGLLPVSKEAGCQSEGICHSDSNCQNWTYTGYIGLPHVGVKVKLYFPMFRVNYSFHKFELILYCFIKSQQSARFQILFLSTNPCSDPHNETLLTYLLGNLVVPIPPFRSISKGHHMAFTDNWVEGTETVANGVLSHVHLDLSTGALHATPADPTWGWTKWSSSNWNIAADVV